MGFLNTRIILLWLYCMISVQSIRRPVIGILMQMNDATKPNSPYVVHGNYVKGLIGAGAFVVPVRVNQGISYYREIISQVHGIMFSGGGTDLTHFDPTDAGTAASIIYKLAEELNEKGVHFPIWGVCQGFQLLAMITAGMKPLLKPCKGLGNVGKSLKFVTKPSDSYMYRNFPREIIKTLQNEPVTAHAHRLCLTPRAMRKYNLTSKWRVLTTSRDSRGLKLITSMEHIRYPFVGVQFHPEKIMYDIFWGFKYRTDFKAILANRWFNDWFVQEARKNSLPLQESRSVKDMLIENCCPLMELSGGFLSQKYLYENTIHPIVVKSQRNISRVIPPNKRTLCVVL